MENWLQNSPTDCRAAERVRELEENVWSVNTNLKIDPTGEVQWRIQVFFSGCPKPPPSGHDIFLIRGGDTVTGSDLHLPLQLRVLETPLETNSGYATEGYRTVVRPALMNGSEALALKKAQEKKLEVTEM